MAGRKKSEKADKIEFVKLSSSEEVSETIKKISDLQKRKQSESDRINQKIQELQNELASIVAPIEREIKELSSSLFSYCGENKEHFKDKKTWSLPTGDLAYRKNPDKVNVKSSSKLIENILEKNNVTKAVDKLDRKLSGMFLRMKIELNKESMLKSPEKAFKATGIQITSGSETFYIKPYETGLELEIADGQA